MRLILFVSVQFDDWMLWQKEKIVRENALKRKKNKSGLKPNHGLALIGNRTTGPQHQCHLLWLCWLCCAFPQSFAKPREFFCWCCYLKNSLFIFYWSSTPLDCVLNSQWIIGFEEGSIKWDDEDTKNDNKASGVLPDGDYGKDTVVDFCCRSDGSADKPIELPMREPFFLLKHSSSCQLVMGMLVTEEWVFWDCEDKENKNLVSGKLPESFVAKDVKLYYCYYIEK